MYYKFFIQNCLENNYKNKTSFSKSLINNFRKYRKSLLYNSKKKLNYSNCINDDTLEKLKKIYNLKSSSKQQNKILIYYKKFEINLALKKKYDHQYKKLTNKETNYNSYIYLGLLVFNSKSLNLFHKLNCILKILDKVSINESSFRILNYKLFIKLLKIENKLLKRIGI